MIASLPMYDRAETREANDRLWTFIQNDLGQGPLELTRSDNPWSDWQDPGLLFSQTCSLPYRTRLARSLTLVASPDYGLPDAPATMRNHKVGGVRSGIMPVHSGKS